MNPTDGKSEPIDPEEAARLLELELMQQRAARKQAGTPYRGLRMVSFVFITVVVLGTLFAFYYAIASGRLSELRSRRNQQATPVPEEITLPAP
jgi:hypothetical protein